MEYSLFERRLIAIDRLKRRKAFSDRQLDIVDSVLAWHKRQGDISTKQDKLLSQIIKAAKKGPAKKNRECMYYLYAITDSREVKLGVSTNVKARLKSLSTGSAKTLKVIWSIPVGVNRTTAFRYERRLHKLCKKYRLKGEWFDMACVMKVYKFEARGLDSKGYPIERPAQINANLDNELLDSIPANF